MKKEGINGSIYFENEEYFRLIIYCYNKMIIKEEKKRRGGDDDIIK